MAGSDQTWVDLAPVPYEMKVPADIADRIAVEDQAGSTGQDFMKQAYKDGAIGVVSVSYQPESGEKTWFMTAYYFLESDLDKTANPDESPVYPPLSIFIGGIPYGLYIPPGLILLDKLSVSFVFFKPETIKRLSEMYLQKKYTDKATLEHDKKIDNIALVESWIVESREKDKSNLYGLNVPVGTWMGTFKIDNEDIWNNYVKTGEVK
jgi:hypothetical protein